MLHLDGNADVYCSFTSLFHHTSICGSHVTLCYVWGQIPFSLFLLATFSLLLTSPVCRSVYILCPEYVLGCIIIKQPLHIVTSSLQIYYIAFSTYNENQNCHIEDITDQTWLFCHKLHTQGMMHPETCFGQTIPLLHVETLFLLTALPKGNTSSKDQYALQCSHYAYWLTQGPSPRPLPSSICTIFYITSLIFYPEEGGNRFLQFFITLYSVTSQNSYVTISYKIF
jgi:hypothetical protein